MEAALVQNIVALDTVYHEMPPFSIPHTLTTYHNTPYSNAPLIASRLKDATIVVTGSVPISAATIALCPKLKLIVLSAVGSDHIDLQACREHGIIVCNTPSATIEAVAEHAIALYFAVKRQILQMHKWVMESKWEADPSGMGAFEGLPLPCSKEILGIVGYGRIGRMIATFAKALGMKVLVAERKDSEARPGRTNFNEVLQKCTTLILACPLDDTTRQLITTKELRLMQSRAILINVARGAVWCEADVVKALESSIIAGVGTDVFENEPATKDTSLLLKEGLRGVVVSPHMGWYGESSHANMQTSIKEIVEGFVAGQPVNVVS